MTIADVKSTTEHKMQKSVEALKIDLAKVRTGRAHIGLLDHVQVDYYGSMVPVNTVAVLPSLQKKSVNWQNSLRKPLSRLQP